MATETPILKLAEERHNMILDANYEAIDLEVKVDALNSLSEHQKIRLIPTLKNFATLFSGGFGTIDIESIHLEIKEDVKPKFKGLSKSQRF